MRQSLPHNGALDNNEKEPSGLGSPGGSKFFLAPVFLGTVPYPNTGNFGCGGAATTAADNCFTSR